MSAPVNTARVIKHVLRDVVVDNDTLIKIAGGSDAQWGQHMKGQRAQTIVRAVNQELKDANKGLASEGIHSEQWRLCTLSEMHRRAAQFSLEHADNSYRNAYNSIQAIVDDIKAPRRLRDNAIAWLELFEEPQTGDSRAILKEFAEELADKTKGQKRDLKLPKPEPEPA